MFQLIMSIEWNSSESKKLPHVQYQQEQSTNGKRKKKIIGQPVESFSNDPSVDNRIKLACSIGSKLPPSHQRLLLELPRDDDKILVADFIIDSYNQKNIALNTKCAYVTTLVHLSRYLGHK
jgi:hypothetical protein